MAEISRRGLLAAAVGIVGAGAIGGVELSRSSAPREAPDVSVGEIASGSFVSARRHGATTGWKVSYPPRADRHAAVPVLVVLHGRGDTYRDAYRSLHLNQYQAAVVDEGTRPFAIASVDGGDHSYWHPRRDGDAAGMVLDEFIPILERRGLDVQRIGFLGWSMGGYGALYLAGRLGRNRCKVAIAESPAIWHHADQSADGAFDDAADFDAHSIFGHLDALTGIPLRIDCGASDGFAPITRDLRAALSPTPAGGIEPGAHDHAYWRSQAKAQLRFAGEQLTR
ncbi:MAG TPA: alpha/beta hydrolase [Jatrophihabitantaceae bacterium]|nr:alpha/beta hydrolase [Jatrophihabitantaceae bacterium]